MFLCVTSTSPTYPTLTIGSVNTSGYRDRFTDVILPGQSYLLSVPESIAFCTNDANLDRFSLLSASVGRTAYSPPLTLVRMSMTLTAQRSISLFWLPIATFSLGLVCPDRLSLP